MKNAKLNSGFRFLNLKLIVALALVAMLAVALLPQPVQADQIL